MLFNLFLKWNMSDALQNHQATVSTGSDNITNLRFADDTDRAGEVDKFVSLVMNTDETSSRRRMKINAEKAQHMMNNDKE